MVDVVCCRCIKDVVAWQRQLRRVTDSVRSEFEGKGLEVVEGIIKDCWKGEPCSISEIPVRRVSLQTRQRSRLDRGWCGRIQKRRIESYFKANKQKYASVWPCAGRADNCHVTDGT